MRSNEYGEMWANHSEDCVEWPVIAVFCEGWHQGCYTVRNVAVHWYTGTVLDRAWSDCCDNLARAVDSLHLINAKDALILLRSSFSYQKSFHLFCCSPSVSLSSLQWFDSLLRLAIQSSRAAANSDLSDKQWIQARLPVKDNGLEVRHVSSLALPAFLTSAASTVSLQEDILSDCACCDNVKSGRHSCARCASSKTDILDRPGVLLDEAVVKSSLGSPSQLVSFLAASFPCSGNWLFTLPIASCGLKLDDEAVRIGVRLRLGLSLCVSHQCRCGSLVDAHGFDRFVCKWASAISQTPCFEWFDQFGLCFSSYSGNQGTSGSIMGSDPMV